MIWVALAALVALTIGLALTTRLTHSLVRQQARERELLLNQIMHLSGRTWTPPPAAEPPPIDDDLVGYVDPANLPEY